MNWFNLLASLLVFLLSSFNSYSQSKKTIYFYEIDDQVAVFVNGNKVWESDVVGHLPGEIELEADITEFVTSVDDEITIKLYNIDCHCASANPWAVSFGIVDNGEELDFQNGKGEGDSGSSPVFSYAFTWDEIL